MRPWKVGNWFEKAGKVQTARQETWARAGSCAAGGMDEVVGNGMIRDELDGRSAGKSSRLRHCDCWFKFCNIR